MADLISFAKGVFASANPFDNGEDFNSVMRKKKQEEQAAQARPSITPPRVGIQQNQQAQRPQTQAPKPVQFSAPSINQNSVINRTNPQLAQQNIQKTELDLKKKQEGIFDVGNIARDIGNAANGAAKAVGGFVLPGTAKITNQALGVTENLGANIAGETQKLFGDKQGGQQTIDNVKRHVDQNLLAPGKGLFNQGGIYQSTDALRTANPADVARKAGGTAIQTAGELFPVLRVAKGATVGVKVANGVASGAASGAIGSAGNQIVQNGNVDGMQTLKDAAVGGAFGGAIPLGGAALSKGAGEIKSLPDVLKTRKLDMASAQSPTINMRLDDVVGSGKQLDPAKVAQYEQEILSGNQKPLIVSRNNMGTMDVLDGDHRLQAYNNLGSDFIPTKTVSPGQMRMQAQGGFIKVPGQPDTAPVRQPDVMAQPQTQPQPSGGNELPPRQVMTAPAPEVPNNLPPQALATIPPQSQKTSRYASKTIPESQFVGDEVSTMTQRDAPKYTPETERGRYEKTLKSADDMGFDTFENDVQNRLNGKGIDSQTVADSQAVAQRLEAKGDDISLRRAAEIYDKVSGHLTSSGQTIQAAAILARRTPAGMNYQALNDIRKAGIDITPEIQLRIKANVDAIAKTQPQTLERKKALGQLAKTVSEVIPQSTTSNLVSVWKAGLLSGAKTTGGGILSNLTFATMKKASDPLTLAADKLMSLKTGQRTVTASQKGGVKGAIEGVKNAAYTLKTGIDVRDVTDKYEQRQGIQFDNKYMNNFLGKPAQKVFNLMSAQDQPFYFSHLKNNLYDLAKADGLNKKLSGQELDRHMDDLVAKPPTEMMQRAVDEANKATLNYDTIASKGIRGIHDGIDNFKGASSAGKTAAHAVVDVLAPFVRVPTAFLSRTVDYTPLGVGMKVFSQVANKQFDQRALSKAIGEGMTGTGVMALGVALTQNDLLSGDYPTDQSEAQRWKAQGITPNSVKIGDTWTSLNYLGPLGMLLSAGKNFEESVKKNEGLPSSVLAATAGLGQSLLGQSFLQGFSGFNDAIQDPERNLGSFVNSQLSSLVPALSNDVANITDQYQRQADNPLEAAKNRIPGLRQTNDIKQDVYGNDLKQAAGQFNTLNPFKPSDEIKGLMLDEIARLSKVDKDNKDLQITPTMVDKTITVDKNKVDLNPQQRFDLQKQYGQSLQEKWTALIGDEKYKSLEKDVDKAKALKKLQSDVKELEQRKFMTSNGLATYEDKLGKGAAKLENGTAKLASYAKTSGDDGSTDSIEINDKITPTAKKTLEDYDALDTEERSKLFKDKNDAEFNYKYAKYENDLANNKLSESEKINTKISLRKEKIGKDYSQNARQLYGVNEKELAAYLAENGPEDATKLANELDAYDRALYDAGLITKPKFKGGIGSSGGGKGKSGAGAQNAAEKASLAISNSVNKIRAPRTTGSKAPSSGTLKMPQVGKAALKKYGVKSAGISTKGDARIKSSKA